jgi:hypothetical protein
MRHAFFLFAVSVGLFAMKQHLYPAACPGHAEIIS